MLDAVLPLAIAISGALLAAIPFVVERRRARVPPSLRMASIFFAAWGIRDLVYGAVAHPPNVVLLAAGATALAAGLAVLRSTFAKSPRGVAVAAMVLGAAHLLLAVVLAVRPR